MNKKLWVRVNRYRDGEIRDPAELKRFEETAKESRDVRRELKLLDAIGESFLRFRSVTLNSYEVRSLIDEVRRTMTNETKGERLAMRFVWGALFVVAILFVLSAFYFNRATDVFSSYVLSFYF